MTQVSRPVKQMFERPAKGTAAKAKRARKRREDVRELLAKATAKQRDHYRCRRCGGATWEQGPLFRHLEAAHLIDQGMGGRHSVSSAAKHYVTLCHACHQGPRSVHSGHVRMEFDADKMGDGRVRFVDVSTEKLLHIRVERDA